MRLVAADCVRLSASAAPWTVPVSTAAANAASSRLDRGSDPGTSDTQIIDSVWESYCAECDWFRGPVRVTLVGVVHLASVIDQRDCIGCHALHRSLALPGRDREHRHEPARVSTSTRTPGLLSLDEAGDLVMQDFVRAGNG